MIDPDRLAAYIKDTGLSYKETNNSFIFTCPRCRKKEKLYIHKHKGNFICFYCREIEKFYGKAEYALAELLNKSIDEIYQEINGEDIRKTPVPFYLEIPWEEEGEELQKDIFLTPTQWPFGSYPISHPFAYQGANYLQSRGISVKEATFYNIYYAPFQSRVLFPIMHNNFLYGWQGRYIYPSSDVPKMITSKDCKKSNFLMFESRLCKGEHVIICEGPIDALKAHLCGGNIATMGKGVSQAQIDRILSYAPSKIYLALDPDAVSEINRLLQIFQEYECYLLWPSSEYKDLGEMTMEAVYQRFQTAPRISAHQLWLSIK